MEVRQLCTPRSATVLKNDGGKLLTVELPSQTLGYDVKKDDGHWYQVDFFVMPGAAPDDTAPVKGSASISEFCEVECGVAELDKKSSKYLRDDSALSVREPVKGFDDSTMTLSYRHGQPWLHLKFLGVDFEEVAWTPGMFDPLRQLAEAYQAERDAFEKKMKAKVHQVGKSDD